MDPAKLTDEVLLHTWFEALRGKHYDEATILRLEILKRMSPPLAMTGDRGSEQAERRAKVWQS